MSGQYTSIIATDYNTIQKNIEAVLGSGGIDPITNLADLSFGYNQSVSSSQIAINAKISSNQWTKLRTDILRARQHQSATTVSLTDPTNAVIITESDRAAYATMALACIPDRNVIPPIADATRSVIATNIVAYSWNGTLTQVITVDFADITAPRYYFNSGGLIEFTASRVNGTVTTKNTAWTDLLTNMGTISFGRIATAVSGTGTPTSVGWLDMTTTDQLIFTKFIDNSVYLNDNYKIFVKQGLTAAQLIFTVQFNDVIEKATSPGGIDEDITGTLTSTVSSYRSTGNNVQVAIPTASAVIGETIPVNNTIPVISGINQVGVVLSTTNGDWANTSAGYTYQWQRGTTNIVNQTSKTYTITPTDDGSTLRVIVTSTNSGGSTSVTSLPTAVIIALAPENTIKPAISGTRQVSNILTTDYGTWLNTPTSYLITWYRDTAAISGASGANATSYTLTSTDLGKTIHVVVTAYNSGSIGGVAQASLDTVPIIDAAAIAGAAPTISTISTIPTQVGSVYTTTNGTWTSNSTITYSYKWQRNSVVDIPNETSTTYTLKVADIGTTIRSVVIATNASGVGVSSSSLSTAAVIDYPPVATALPVISGSITIGNVLSMTTAPTWNNSTTSFKYTWKRSGVAITSSTTPATYTTVAADVGKSISLTVTAYNTGSPTTGVSTTSTATAAIIDLAPFNSGLPQISGSTIVGQTLSATAGTWTQGIPTSYTYQWYRGTTAVGTNSSTYTLISTDHGNTMHVTVTVYNSGATSGVSATSSNTVAITAVPVNSGLPTLSASPDEIRVGNTLTTTAGTWNYSPTSYTISWYRGASTFVGSGYSYVLASGDIGNTMYSSVTATNAAGSSSAANSGTTAAVIDKVPVNTVVPTISGTSSYGSTLSISSYGTWSNTPTSWVYQWQRAGVDISGATSTSYTLVAGDIGNPVRLTLFAKNSGGTSAGAGSTGRNIIDVNPTNSVAPSISGSALVGYTLTASVGTWSSNSTITYSYSWLRNGGVIGAYSSTYLIAMADIGNIITCQVSASNTGAGASALSNGIAITTNYSIEISYILPAGGDTVYPTSKIPVVVTEGAIINMSVAVDNNPASTTTLWWQAGGGGVSTADFSPNTAYRGAIPISTVGIAPGYARESFDITINTDTVNEAAETFLVALRSGSQEGPDVASSQYITIRGEYSTPGTYTFTVPAGISQLRARVIGGGGGGNTGHGGGAAGYIWGYVAVTAGQAFTVIVGAGGNGGNASACTSGGKSQVTNNNGTYVTGDGGTRATTTAVGSGGGAGWNVFTEIASAVGDEGTLTAGGTNITTFGGSAGNGGAPLTDGINGLVHIWYL